MKFSIIIPALNEAESIGPSIAAILRQTVARRDFEIVVVDGNSTDNTVAVARAAGADIVISEKSNGPNFSRQRGVEISHGDIIVFLDADSEPRPDWLERIGSVLARPGVAAVSGPYDYGFKGLARIIDQFQLKLLPFLPTLLHLIFRRKAGVLIGGNFAAYRKGIEAIGGLPPLKFFGDDAAAAMLLSRRVGKVVFDPSIVVKSSPRRFERDGVLNLQLKYIKAYFGVYFSKEYR